MGQARLELINNSTRFFMLFVPVLRQGQWTMPCALFYLCLPLATLCQLNQALCPMLLAPCPVPYALCSAGCLASCSVPAAT